jgi:transcriptional regulator with XRE-family HTH domain
MTFGDYLERLILGAGITREDLANASGVDATTIGRWLRNQKAPTVEKLRLVAPHLGVRLGDLMIRAGLATAAELGTVGAPPPPRAPLPAELQRVVSILKLPDITEHAKQTLLEALDQTTTTWLKLINPRREPRMRGR